MEDHELREAAARLKHGPDGLAWQERRDLARRLGESLANGPARRVALALLDMLALDPKWEVRREVAEQLLVVPMSDLPRLAARLCADTNRFVRLAAERATDRRQDSAKQDLLARQSIDEIGQRLGALAEKHGRAAARQARWICDRYGELVVGAMAHDLRTIQTYLTSHCRALVAEGHHRRRAAVRVIQDLEFLDRTIADMLAFTRPAPTERHRESIGELLCEARDLALDNVRPADGRVRIEMDVPAGLTVQVARHLIVMSLGNVIKNALEACLAGDRSGQVRITAMQREEFAEITVSDNGIGMSDEEKEGWSQFVPGRRNKAKRLSTGYGLPIAVRNLAAHGGTLTLESTENEGTIVTIRLSLEIDE